MKSFIFLLVISIMLIKLNKSILKRKPINPSLAKALEKKNECILILKALDIQKDSASFEKLYTNKEIYHKCLNFLINPKTDYEQNICPFLYSNKELSSKEELLEFRKSSSNVKKLLKKIKPKYDNLMILFNYVSMNEQSLNDLLEKNLEVLHELNGKIFERKKR